MRKLKWFLCLTVVVLSPAARAGAEAQADEPMAIAESVAGQLVKVFNTHDVAGLVAFHAPDCDAVFLSGPSFDALEFVTVRGLKEIESSYKQFFETFPGATIKRGVTLARFVTPDVIISDGWYEITGLPKQEGPIRANCMVVMRKQGNSWKTVAVRNVDLVPRPPRPKR